MTRLLASGILITFLILLYIICNLSDRVFLFISVALFAVFEIAVLVFYNHKDW
ncbi:hypothetical protein CAURIC_00180 [Corynebacterium auriscanis]|nr:hypothetical protein CAURIC_00180 [Corynebacterium auriscanis]